MPAWAISPSDGSRARPTDSADDEELKPRLWKTTVVKIGAGFNALSALHFIQDLQLPNPRIPFLTSMTFYAPKEAPVVTIGLYYERNAESAAARDVLTSSAFVLQSIADLDSPLRYEAGQIETVQSGHMSDADLGWFAANRQRIVDSMRASAEGAVLSKVYDADFTTRARPPADTPAALVIAGANYAGFKVPYTVIAQRIVFTV